MGDCRSLDCNHRQTSISEKTKHTGNGCNHPNQAKVLWVQQAGQHYQRTQAKKEVCPLGDNFCDATANRSFLEIVHRELWDKVTVHTTVFCNSLNEQETDRWALRHLQQTAANGEVVRFQSLHQYNLEGSHHCDITIVAWKVTSF